jgi:hypothetical protein
LAERASAKLISKVVRPHPFFTLKIIGEIALDVLTRPKMYTTIQVSFVGKIVGI